MTFNPDFHHRHSIRLPFYDYAQAGLYFVTICTHERRPLFGVVVDGEMVLTEAGNIAKDTWLQTPVLRPNITLHDFIVMPNHLHGIIEIVGAQRLRPNNLITGQEAWRENGREHRAPTLGDVVRGYKSSVSKHIKALKDTSIDTVWQRNYHEHVIRNEQSYLNIAQYIQSNPLRWQDDRYWTE